MGNKSKFDRAAEVYKCIVLTVIAIILLFIFLRTPVPFTTRNLRDRKVKIIDIPVVKTR